MPTRGVMAQQTSPASAAGTTLAGVYTTTQAARGGNTYAGMCRSCHTPESHTGATFRKWWEKKRVADLYQFIGEKMPKNDPGTLSYEDTADVVAYLLKMNAMPAGPQELPADSVALASIRIVTLKRGKKP
ncbi:MAG TPA: cytochrome c [Gemmatimonadaceae bacterium]|nr:cytochrome c [Gemmatimonadaceae bacterium]